MLVPISNVSLKKLLLVGCFPLFALFLQQFELLKSWDHAVYDAELGMFSRSVNEEIVIIAIDESSLGRLGKWPWSHRTHAKLIDLLTKAEVRAIGFDIIFAEPEREDSEADRLFINSIRANGRVVLPVFPDMSNGDKKLKVSLPWRELAQSAAGLGHVDIEIDPDGVVRSVYLTAGTEGFYWPALPLAVLAVDRHGSDRYIQGVRNPFGRNISNGTWSRDFRVEIPFVSDPSHFIQVSYADVLSNPKIRERLRGKYVLVGATVSGLAQTFVTPMYKSSGPITGVEVNANVLDALMRDITLQPLTKILSLLLTALLVVIPIAAYNFFFQSSALLFSLLCSALALVSSAGFLKIIHSWYSPVPAILALLVAYIFWNVSRFKFFLNLLQKERQLANATFNSIADAVITTDSYGLIVYLNPIAEKLTGYSLLTAKGLPIDSVVRFVDGQKEYEYGFSHLINHLLKGRTIKDAAPKYIVNNAGTEYAIQINASPISGESEKITGAVFAFSDITEMLQNNQKVSHMFTHDMVTGLPNQAFFFQQVDLAIATSQRFGSSFALLFIDLDDFKKVNDGLGHTVGDLLLKEVADRLVANMRQVDTVARWGGDEFIVLLNQLPMEENITGIILKILDRLSQPFFFEGQTLYVTPSIGISVFPKDGKTSEELLINAETALFQVKDSGRNNFRFFSSGFDKSAKLRLVLEKEMYCALDETQFEIYYQPQIEPKTNKIVGAEALLRWNHPLKGLLGPDAFISLAEETGLINPIGDWVFHTVCKQIGSWQSQGFPAVCIAVNISPRQFLQSNLSAKIDDALKQNNVSANLLKIEITESLMIKNVDAVAQMLWCFRALGISIAIDDFGTGFSSLSALKNFPIDQLKIDKSFITHICYNRDDANIAQSIISLGHNMRMKVVAEGVENKAQLDILNQWGCDYIQGYFFSKPLTSAKMTELLQQGGYLHKAEDVSFFSRMRG